VKLRGYQHRVFVANHEKRLARKHGDPREWLIEPLDSELDVWTLGTEFGCIFAVVSSSDREPRVQVLTREEGIAALREQWRADSEHVRFSGGVLGDSIEFEHARLVVPFDEDGRAPDVMNEARLLAHVCEYLQRWQDEDGDRMVAFEDACKSGSFSAETFEGVIGLHVPSVTGRGEA
jgi:hypothetical protein